MRSRFRTAGDGLHPLKPGPLGFTLLEIVITLAVIGVLAAILFTSSRGIIEKSESVSCMNNMRNLIPAFTAYVQDKGTWPQEPRQIWDANDDVAHENWWMNELKPFGLEEKSWQCPTIRRKISSKDPQGRPRMHYSPTMFEAGPLIPFKWATQPWFVEIGNMHGRGAFICFPDGSIKTINDF